MQRLIATTEGARPLDVRDRAILLLLAVYALRSGEVRTSETGRFGLGKGLAFRSPQQGAKERTLSLSPLRLAKPSSAISRKGALALRIEKSS